MTLSWAAGQGSVRFTVADTGEGIAPEHLGRIFDHFYRADPARSRADGSGVGLTIARGLATRMGGTLNVTSGPAGSTFTLTLLIAHCP